MSRIRPPQVLLPCLTLLLSLCVTASPATAQDNRPAVQFGDKVYLSLHRDKNLFVTEPESSSNWPCMRRGTADNKVVLEVHGTKDDNGDIRHGSLVSIKTTVTTSGGYDRLYLSQGGWVYCDTYKERGQADEQWWTIERTHGEGVVRDGDHVTFRNRYWRDQFINIEAHNYWLTGAKNASAFTIDLKNKPTAKLALGNGAKKDDHLYYVVYGRNQNRATISGSTKTWSLGESQQVQLGEEKSNNWELGLTVGYEAGNNNIKQKTEVSAKYGQAMAAQRQVIKDRKIDTSLTLTFDVPQCDAIFHIYKIKIPYVVWDVPGSVNEGVAQTLQLRRFDGGLDTLEHEIVTIPSKDDDGNIIPVEYAEVDRALSLYAMNKSDSSQANTLRQKLAEWQGKGWVTIPTGLKSGKPKVARLTMESLAGLRFRRPMLYPVERECRKRVFSKIAVFCRL